VDERAGIADCLDRLAAVACAEGHPEHAAILVGAAQGWRDVVSAPRAPAERADYEQTLAAARAGLDVAGFAAAWARGVAMSREQAIAYALASEPG
jgi:hypothetical protein